MSKAVKVIANTLDLSYDTEKEFKNEYQYQPTRTAQPIFTNGTDYFAIGAKQPKDEVGQPWKLHSDQFWAEKNDTKLWVSEKI